MNQLIINWTLTTVSYPLLVVLVMLAVNDEKKSEEEKTEEAPPSAYPASVSDTNNELTK